VSIPITKPVFGPEELRAVQLPLETGWIVQGPYVKTFEDRFAHLHEDTPEALGWQWERDRLAQEAAVASPNYVPVRNRLRELLVVALADRASRALRDSLVEPSRSYTGPKTDTS